MPSIQSDEATIYFEEHGKADGFPVLCFAPAGLMSTIDVWNRPMSPVNPVTEFGDAFRVIVMDQRNAGGQSKAPIKATDGWDEYAADHIAILDHLGIQQCHLMGQCIGGPFIFALLQAIPDRIVSAVIAQPIGRVGEMPAAYSPNFTTWIETTKPDADDKTLDAFYHNLYDPGFGYSVDRDSVRGCQTPCLVLAGNDNTHPFAIAEEMAQLLPHSEFIAEWKEGDALQKARQRMKEFLSEHTPVGVK
jgi:pimeloyl-ACP methyl ester carboxylesterase